MRDLVHDLPCHRVAAARGTKGQLGIEGIVMERSGNLECFDAEAEIRRARRIRLDRINVSAGPAYGERAG